VFLFKSLYCLPFSAVLLILLPESRFFHSRILPPLISVGLQPSGSFAEVFIGKQRSSYTIMRIIPAYTFQNPFGSIVEEGHLFLRRIRTVFPGLQNPFIWKITFIIPDFKRFHHPLLYHQYLVLAHQFPNSVLIDVTQTRTKILR